MDIWIHSMQFPVINQWYAFYKTVIMTIKIEKICIWNAASSCNANFHVLNSKTAISFKLVHAFPYRDKIMLVGLHVGDLGGEKVLIGGTCPPSPPVYVIWLSMPRKPIYNYARGICATRGKIQRFCL